MRRGSGAARGAVVVGALAALVAVRVAVEPRALPAAAAPALAGAARARVADALAAGALDRDALLRALSARRVLLVGESHFQEAPPAWLVSTLDALHALDGRPTVLLLELPESMQRDLDAHRRSRDDAALQAAWHEDALPYGGIVRWASAHADAVAEVEAFDESRFRVIAARALGTDTRNRTMASAIAREAREHPEARVVAYGGTAHMMLAGRYLYDHPSRIPVGARLVEAGLERPEVAAVWLLPDGAPIRAAWPAGAAAVALDGAAGELAPELLLDVPVARADRVAALADFAVLPGAPAAAAAGRR